MRTRSPAAAAAGSPQAGHVEKWQLALDMIDEARSWGVEVPLVVADAGYGDAAAFRLGLEERKLPYVVGISSRHTAQPAGARPVQPAYAGTGRPPKLQYPEPAQTIKDLVIEAGRTAARPVSWREGSRPGRSQSGFKRMYSRFVALRIRPAGRGLRKTSDTLELPERWLLAEWPADESGPVHETQKTRRRSEPLPGRPGTADTPRHLGRRLPHLPPRHTHTHTNLTKPY